MNLYSLFHSYVFLGFAVLVIVALTWADVVQPHTRWRNRVDRSRTSRRKSVFTRDFHDRRDAHPE